MKYVILLTTLLSINRIGMSAQATVNDREGNEYNTVTIGAQIWFKENLRVQSFNNGTPIPEISLNADWSALTSPGLSWYENDSASYNIPYGILYNGYVIAESDVCPTGWRVPTDNDWSDLSTFLGGSTVAGGKLKEAGISHWTESNIGDTNESGFTALPGGTRFNHGGFSSITIAGRWWSSTPTPNGYMDRSLVNSTSSLYTNTAGVLKNGFSIRCMKDAETGLGDQDVFNRILIYPNPAKDVVTLISHDRDGSSLDIYTAAGACVLKAKLIHGVNTISISFLEKGSYNLRIEGSDGISIHKLLKD